MIGIGTFALALGACGEGEPNEDGTATDTSEDATTAATSDATATSTTGSQADCGGLPVTAAGMADWLAGGEYQQWTAESAPHDSAGPHFGDVRVFVNDCLADSLAQGSDAHPAGAASVKELYGAGTQVRGYAVMVKVEEGPGADWYWYERYNGSQFADGVDDGTCIGCHEVGIDSVRTTWPLQ